MDDQIIYEKDEVWLFDVAEDGSSFFFIEPLGSDYSSRLIIVNLEQGTETHHDLGTIFEHPEQRLRYLASYTTNNAEVHLEPTSPAYSKGLGIHYFFDVQAGGTGRGIWVPNAGRYNGAFFVGNDNLVVRRFPTRNDVIDETRRFYDVYDLNSISLYDQPRYRA